MTETLVIASVLCRRDLMRFIRQPTRIAAALGTPVLLWAFLAAGVGTEVRPADVEITYGAYLMPGMLTLVAVFASIFSSISIIEDRNEGWLQAVLASPAPRLSIALGRAAGGAIVAWIQAALLVPLLIATDLDVNVGGLAVALIMLAVTALSVSALGLFFAWGCPTSSAFHAIMNLVFMPLWLLSGAFFTIDGAHPVLGWIMRCNPLTWCTEAIRAPLEGRTAGLESVGAIAFAVAMVVLAAWRVAVKRG